MEPDVIINVMKICSISINPYQPLSVVITHIGIDPTLINLIGLHPRLTYPYRVVSTCSQLV